MAVHRKLLPSLRLPAGIGRFRSRILIPRFPSTWSLLPIFALTATIWGTAAATAQTLALPSTPGQAQPATAQPAANAKSSDTSKDEVSVAERVDSAAEAVYAQRYGQAQTMLEEILKEHPDNLRALSLVSFVYEQLATQARKAATDPATDPAYNKWVNRLTASYLRGADIAQQQNDLQTAEQMYERVLAYEPGNAAGLFGIAHVYTKLGRSMQAIEQYNDFLKANPPLEQQPEAYRELGRNYINAKLWRQAIRALKANVIAPGDAEANSLLAQANYGLNRLDEALEAMQNAVRSAPGNPEYQNRFAALLLAAGRIEPAVEASRRCIELGRQKLRDDPSNMQLIGDMNSYARIYRQALDQLLAQDQTNVRIRIELSQAVQLEGDLAQLQTMHQAVRVLQATPANQAGDPAILEALASLQVTLRDPAAADTCRKLLEVDPTNAAAKQFLARLEPSPATTAPGG